MSDNRHPNPDRDKLAKEAIEMLSDKPKYWSVALGRYDFEIDSNYLGQFQKMRETFMSDKPSAEAKEAAREFYAMPSGYSILNESEFELTVADLAALLDAYAAEQMREALNRLTKIAEILELRDQQLLANDGPVPQDPPWLRKIYLLAKGKKP